MIKRLTAQLRGTHGHLDRASDEYAAVFAAAVSPLLLCFSDVPEGSCSFSECFGIFRRQPWLSFWLTALTQTGYHFPQMRCAQLSSMLRTSAPGTLHR